MRKILSFPLAFVNSNAGKKLFFCSTPQFALPLNAAAFAALTWIEVKGVGDHGETGTTTNILTYDTWDTDVAQKAKGISDAGSPDLELSRLPTDAGQIALRAAALTDFNYAFKVQGNDEPSVAGTPTLLYNCGLVSGPRRPLGRNEDFDLEIFSLALNQREVVVAPTTGA